MAITQTLTTPPEAPQRSDPSTFADRADAFVSWIAQFRNDLENWTDQANDTEQNINNLEEQTKTYRDQTEAFRDEASATANAVPYNNSDTYSYPDVVVGSDGHSYRCLGTNVQGDDPVSSTTGNWKRITAELPADEYLHQFGISGVSYDSSNRVHIITFSNNYTATIAYNDAGFVSTIEYKNPNDELVLKLSFNYDSNNLLTSITRETY